MRQIKLQLRVLKDTPPWDWPEDAGKMLLEVLRNDRTGESDLSLAAKLAGDMTVIDDELADALLSILQSDDKSEKVRGTAAISLGPVLEDVDTESFGDSDDLPIAEATFHKIQEVMHRLYMDAKVPTEVQRRVLEAAVRAPQDWHQAAVHAAYQSDDERWRLTAVFCMGFVRGFDDEILEALESKNPEIHYEAVLAAGNWELDAAWPHIAALVTSGETEKPLLLAAIEAASSIRPRETAELLDDLAATDDEDILEAVDEALAMSESFSTGGEDDEDDELNDEDESLR